MISKNWTQKILVLFNAFIHFIVAESEQILQNNGNTLLNFNGNMRSTLNGDPVNSGMGVISTLPSQFGVNVSAVWNNGDNDYVSYPLNLGYDYICQNGNKNADRIVGPKIYWDYNGKLFINFASPDGYSYSAFAPKINVKTGDVMTVQLKIYQDKFYASYAVNSNNLLVNAMTTFDGQVCGFSDCYVYGNYRQSEQYNVPVSAIDLPTLNADSQGCGYSYETYSSLTTNVKVWSL